MRSGAACCTLAIAVWLAGCGSNELVEVAAGGTRSCLRSSADEVRCWGGGAQTAGVLTPALVPNTRGATELCAGDVHACARVQGGKVRCWGAGADAVATEVSGLNDVSKLVCGDRGGCALSSAGDVRCWVWTAEGPGAIEPVANLSSSKVSVGAKHVCAVKDDQLVWCWGDNSDGQLGVSPASVPSSAEPIQVQGLTNATAVAAAAQHTCALGQDGKVRCWGTNETGQLGRPGAASVVPVEVEGLTGVASLSAGANHTCAVLADKTVRCWGRNLYGQLGNATTLDQHLPVEASGLNEVAQVAAGRDHTCALHGDPAQLSCWGRNLAGQLGDGTRDDRSVPAPVVSAGE